MSEAMTVVPSTSCEAWAIEGIPCNVTACTDLLYIGAVLLNAVCAGGISGTVGLALERLDVFINRQQKALRAPALFELNGTVTGGNASIETIAILASATWNVVMLRDGTCSALPGVLELDCMEHPTNNRALLTAFEARHLESPRARVRAKLVLVELNVPVVKRDYTIVYLVFEGLLCAAILILVVQCLRA